MDRSGDSHPVLSGGRGAWKGVAESEFDATYIAFRLDDNREWIGCAKARIHIVACPGVDELSGDAKASILDFENKEIGTGESHLEGKRILVEPS